MTYTHSSAYTHTHHARIPRRQTQTHTAFTTHITQTPHTHAHTNTHTHTQNTRPLANHSPIRMYTTRMHVQIAHTHVTRTQAPSRASVRVCSYMWCVCLCVCVRGVWTSVCVECALCVSV